MIEPIRQSFIPKQYVNLFCSSDINHVGHVKLDARNQFEDLADNRFQGTTLLLSMVCRRLSWLANICLGQCPSDA